MTQYDAPPNTIGFSITPEFLKAIQSKEQHDSSSHPATDALQNAATHASVQKIALDTRRIDQLHATFSDELDVDTVVSDQKQSGRCWLFSFLNVLRAHAINRYGLRSDFEFSQSYMYFWHMFERSNWFLEAIWQMRKEPLESVDMRTLLSEPVSDGGQWHMIQNLVSKYGVVPAHCMAESYQANHTETLNTLLCARLRRFAWEIRSNLLPRAQHLVRRKQMMHEVYRLLCAFLGSPPDTIRWEVMPDADKVQKGKAHNKPTTHAAATVATLSAEQSTIQKKPYARSEWLTPIEFFNRYVGFPVEDYVTVIHYPVEQERPFHRKFTVRMLNNMVGGRKSELYNVPRATMQELAKRSIDAGEPVWFCADVEKDFSEKFGVMDPLAFQYSSLFGSEKGTGVHGWEKGARMLYRDGRPNHAMVLRGYHSDSSPNAQSVSRKKFKTHPPATRKTKHTTTTSPSCKSGTQTRPHRVESVHIDNTRKKEKKSRGGRRGTTLSTPNPIMKTKTKTKTNLHTTPKLKPRATRATLAKGDPPSRWLVENSWGDSVGFGGHFVMSRCWFDHHVYEIAVHKRHLKGLWKETPGQETIVLQPWDAFGCLF
jgi:bleomycin hydrolase